MKSIYEFLFSEHLLKSKTAVSTQDTDYVDLELPSGLLWATCNIGADEPYEYGDYFMWGSTNPDTDKPCSWKTCPFNNGSYGYDEDYFESIKNKVCPNDILAPEYDAATAILGDEWRMPTAKEYRELINNTTYEWTRNYNNSGINGMLFTSKNDAELFIPAAGYRRNTSFYEVKDTVCVWNSIISSSTPKYAMCMLSTATHGYINDIDIVFILRTYAANIRAVRDR